MTNVNTNISREYRDLDLSFKIHPIKKDINKHVAEYAVINSLKNLMSLGHYEKPFQPEIGSNLKKLLFEPLDNVSSAAIQREMETIIGNFEPRVSTSKLQLIPDYDNNGYKINLEFYIINRTDPVTIKFFLERAR
jgi:phage baseplate assembly protein W